MLYHRQLDLFEFLEDVSALSRGFFSSNNLEESCRLFNPVLEVTYLAMTSKMPTTGHS